MRTHESNVDITALTCHRCSIAGNKPHSLIHLWHTTQLPQEKHKRMFYKKMFTCILQTIINFRWFPQRIYLFTCIGKTDPSGPGTSNTFIPNPYTVFDLLSSSQFSFSRDQGYFFPHPLHHNIDIPRVWHIHQFTFGRIVLPKNGIPVFNKKTYAPKVISQETCLPVNGMYR